MKYLILISGIFLILFSIIKLSMYAMDYGLLSDYGKGYVWGSLLYFVIGILLFIVGIKKFNRYNQEADL